METFLAKERAGDPGTPLRELRALVALYPVEVLQNPAFPLLALEDPGLFVETKLRAERWARLYRARGHLERLLSAESWQKALRGAHHQYDLRNLPGRHVLIPDDHLPFPALDPAPLAPVLYPVLAMEEGGAEEPVGVWVSPYAPSLADNYGRYLGQMVDDRALVFWSPLQGGL